MDAAGVRPLCGCPQEHKGGATPSTGAGTCSLASTSPLTPTDLGAPHIPPVPALVTQGPLAALVLSRCLSDALWAALVHSRFSAGSPRHHTSGSVPRQHRRTRLSSMALALLNLIQPCFQAPLPSSGVGGAEGTAPSAGPILAMGHDVLTTSCGWRCMASVLEMTECDHPWLGPGRVAWGGGAQCSVATVEETRVLGSAAYARGAQRNQISGAPAPGWTLSPSHVQGEGFRGGAWGGKCVLRHRLLLGSSAGGGSSVSPPSPPAFVRLPLRVVGLSGFQASGLPGA